MNPQAPNRLAHLSSVVISSILNFLLFLGIVYFAKFEREGGQPEQAIKYLGDDLGEKPITEEPGEAKPLEDPEPHIQIKDSFVPVPMPSTHVTWGTETLDPPHSDQAPHQLTKLFTENTGLIIMPGVYLGRTEKGKQALLQSYGTIGQVSEESATRALDWLKDHQQEDGSWSKNGSATGSGNAGYTGLALLTFLSNGETPVSKDYGVAIAKAIRFLVEHQDGNGVFRPAGAHTVYGHAIATYALAEAYVMTDNPLLHEPLTRAVNVIIKGQQPNGGYDYEYKQENRNDLSVGAWHVQALKAVMATPVANREVRLALQSSMDGMLEGSKMSKEGGRGFTYTVRGGEIGAPRTILSAAGTLGLYMTGRSKQTETREAVAYLKQFTESDQLPKWNLSNPENEHGGEIMFWYYASQAFFQENPEGRNFKRFVPAMVKALAENQALDGHWLGFSEKAQAQGPVFNTTLGAMSLMVFYRYGDRNLPSTMRREPIRSEPSEANEDIRFDI